MILMIIKQSALKMDRRQTSLFLIFKEFQVVAILNIYEVIEIALRILIGFHENEAAIFELRVTRSTFPNYHDEIEKLNDW